MNEGKEIPQQRIINFKGEQGRDVDVNLNRLTSVFANTELHNRKFSPLRRFGGPFKNQFIENRINKAFEEEERKTFSETLQILHSSEFRKIGVSFSEALQEEELEFSIQSPSLFLNFLNALESEDQFPSQTSEMIGKIRFDLSVHIREYYLGYLKDENLPIIQSNLDMIVATYKKLGIKAQLVDWDEAVDETGKLESYAQYSRWGILEEYIKVKDFQEQHERKGGIILDWTTEQKSIENRLSETISFFKKIGSNPKAKDYLNEIKTGLLKDIDVELQEINSKDESWDKKHEWYKREEKKEIFENAKINLQII
jgi:hypothetical protein